jgi:osmotically-inducible protein OsmY
MAPSVAPTAKSSIDFILLNMPFLPLFHSINITSSAAPRLLSVCYRTDVCIPQGGRLPFGRAEIMGPQVARARRLSRTLPHGLKAHRRRNIVAPHLMLDKMNMKTDAQLKQDIIAELTWEPSVNASQIGVEVKDGTVTLAGHVDSYTEKWQAERAAQRVAGIKGLAIEMDVKLPGPSKRTDADIARSAQNVLEWTTYLPREAVKVKCENGWITLSGEVEWDFQRQAVKDAVRPLLGVTGVSDEITVKPRASMSAVKSAIEAALKRQAHADAQRISVEVNGGDVTLSGKVHNWSERSLATSSAWAAPGVRNVVDKLTISY